MSRARVYSLENSPRGLGAPINRLLAPGTAAGQPHQAEFPEIAVPVRTSDDADQVRGALASAVALPLRAPITVTVTDLPDRMDGEPLDQQARSS